MFDLFFCPYYFLNISCADLERFARGGPTPFKWRFADGPMMAQHWMLVASWLTRGSGDKVLLRDPIALWFSSGVRTPSPLNPLDPRFYFPVICYLIQPVLIVKECLILVFISIAKKHYSFAIFQRGPDSLPPHPLWIRACSFLSLVIWFSWYSKLRNAMLVLLWDLRNFHNYSLIIFWIEINTKCPIAEYGIYLLI